MFTLNAKLIVDGSKPFGLKVEAVDDEVAFELCRVIETPYRIGPEKYYRLQIKSILGSANLTCLTTPQHASRSGTPVSGPVIGGMTAVTSQPILWS